MLAKIRKLTEGIFFKIILIAVIASFVIWGIGGFIMNSGSGNWVAKITGHRISTSQYLEALQKERAKIRGLYSKQGKNIDEKILESLDFKRSVLLKMLSPYITQQALSVTGLTINDEMAMDEIASFSGLQKPNGDFDSVKFNEILTQNETTEKEFLEIIKSNIAQRYITSMIGGGQLADPVIANFINVAQKEVRSAFFLEAKSSNMTGVKEPNQSDLNSFYQKNQTKFLTKEMRVTDYVVIRQSYIKSKVATAMISDEDANAFYEKSKSHYQKPELRDIEHLLFKNKADADSVLTTIKSSSDMKLAIALQAKKLGQGSSSMTDLDKSALPPALGEAIFTAKTGELLGPIKSDLGYHVILLQNIKLPAQIPFSLVKASIKEKMIAESKNKQIADLLKSIEESLVSAKSLKDVAEKFGLELKRVTLLSQEELNNAPPFKDFVPTIFALNKGQISSFSRSVDFTNKSKPEPLFFVAQLVELQPARLRDLAEIKALATAMWRDETRQETARNLINKALAELSQNKINEASIKAVAKKHNLELRYFAKIERPQDRSKADPAILATFLAGRKFPAISKIYYNDITKTTGFAIALSAIQPQSSLKNDKLMEQNSARITGDIMSGYEQYLEKKFKFKINEELLKKL